MFATSANAYRRFEAVLDRFGLAALFRYGLTGAAATTAHASAAMFLFHLVSAPALLANMTGFICGAVISYLGSYYFTFCSSSPHREMVLRFLAVWIIGIAVNGGVFSILMAMQVLPFEGNLAAAIIITPLAQFLLLRFWAFRPKAA